MNDLTSQINQILSNPEMMEQIMGLSGLLGQSAPESAPQQKQIPMQTTPQPQQMQSSPLDLLGSDGMQTIMKIMPIISQIKQEDDTTRLLRAIKPFLSPERQEKLEEAIKILRILKILPMLKGQGLFNLF